MRSREWAGQEHVPCEYVRRKTLFVQAPLASTSVNDVPYIMKNEPARPKTEGEAKIRARAR